MALAHNLTPPSTVFHLRLRHNSCKRSGPSAALITEIPGTGLF
jgi:hypothetical protein